MHVDIHAYGDTLIKVHKTSETYSCINYIKLTVNRGGKKHKCVI